MVYGHDVVEVSAGTCEADAADWSEATGQGVYVSGNSGDGGSVWNGDES